MADNDVVEHVTPIGCEHYQRNCALVAPCCKKIYTCRLCHNDQEDHDVDRFAVNRVQCLECKTEQEIGNKCISCDIIFGSYYCNICHLYDNVDKGQFHCAPCGICRIGGKEAFYHCDKCGICLVKSLQENHKCIEQATRSNCPVCMEDLHSSRKSITRPKCGHYIHSECSEEMLRNGMYTCPVCTHSIVDMREAWSRLDAEVEQTVMPEEYRNIMKNILCCDCNKKSRVKFHVIGMKCQFCGSYNTCNTEGDENEEAPDGAAVENVELQNDEELANAEPMDED